MSVEIGSSLRLVEPIFDAIPAPLLLVERGTARVLYANAAGDELAGGDHEVYSETGRRLEGDEHPIARAARGERFADVRVDWVTGAGRRSVVVSSLPLSLEAGDLALVTFEDVTELAGARRRATLLADAGAVLGHSLDPREVARSVAHVAVPAYA